MSEPELVEGETYLRRIEGNRSTYIKEHVLLAALGSVIMAGALVYMGNPYPWTGVVGAVLAITARGVYVADEQLGFVWHLTDRRLVGPGGRVIRLAEVAQVRTIFSAAQVITKSGDKQMLKYLADPRATAEAIEEASR